MTPPDHLNKTVAGTVAINRISISTHRQFGNFLPFCQRRAISKLSSNPDFMTTTLYTINDRFNDCSAMTSSYVFCRPLTRMSRKARLLQSYLPTISRPPMLFHVRVRSLTSVNGMAFPCNPCHIDRLSRAALINLPES